MRVCIHRGTREVGGTCIEIESQGQRIVLDLGLPLDGIDSAAHLPDVSGFREPQDSLLAVVISHPHLDHYGLARHLPPDTPMIMGAATERILKASTACRRRPSTAQLQQSLTRWPARRRQQNRAD